MRILIVDDEEVSRKKLTKILQTLGDCEAVDTGEKALNAFKDAYYAGSPFDIVTMDVGLPEMNGTEIVNRLRLMEKKASEMGAEPAKIIMVTSHADKDTVMESVASGCDDFIVKPFDGETIISKLSGLLFPSD